MTMNSAESGLARHVAILGIASTLLAPAAGAQTIAERVARVGSGTALLSYATREGVCGDGAGSIGFGDGRRTMRFGSVHVSRDEWEPDDCVPGPARVALTVQGGAVTRVRVYVGGRWRASADSAVDLGTVSAAAAADYLLGIAERTEGSAGSRAVLAASLADSAVVWPRMLRLARDDTRPKGTRREATFWVAEEAGRRVEGGERGPAAAGAESDEQEIREQAVFALSQRPREESVPALVRVARTNRDPAIRRKAIFWLGQSGDARALAFFEEVLNRR